MTKQCQQSGKYESAKLSCFSQIGCMFIFIPFHNQKRVLSHALHWPKGNCYECLWPLPQCWSSFTIYALHLLRIFLVVLSLAIPKHLAAHWHPYASVGTFTQSHSNKCWGCTVPKNQKHYPRICNCNHTSTALWRGPAQRVGRCWCIWTADPPRGLS